MSGAAVPHLVHPGPVAAERMESRADATARALRFRLPGGMSLVDGLAHVFASVGAKAAAVNLSGGVFSRLTYCIAAPSPDAPQVARYSDPIPLDGPVTVLAASATYGLDLEGRPLVHCHALLAGPDGRVTGGHVVPHTAIAGACGPLVTARLFDRVGIVQRYDPETMMAIFHPAPAAAHGGAHDGS